MNWIPSLDNLLLANIISSFFLLIAVFILRGILVRTMAHYTGHSVDARRRWMVSIRNGLLVVFITGLVFIWATELRTFALSLVAIAVALVIATKELILCISGAVLRASADTYSIGDNIEIDGMRGEVFDYNLLATTILEIGPGKSSHQYTGRSIVLPNSLLLSGPLINENFMNEYVVHVFSIPLGIDEDWQTAERLLLEVANAECSPFLDDARRHMKTLEDKKWLDTPSVEPRVTIEIREPDRINLLLRVPSPARRKGRVEQAILRRFLSSFTKARVSKTHEAHERKVRSK